MKAETKNNIQAVGGLLLTGAGLSMAINASAEKAKGKKWFWYGMMALVVFQAGVCLVADTARNHN